MTEVGCEQFNTCVVVWEGLINISWELIALIVSGVEWEWKIKYSALIVKPRTVLDERSEHII